MISDSPSEAFVWTWLPDAIAPVVAGRLEAVGDIVQFNYGRSYLERDNAIPLYLPELPLERRVFAPPAQMKIAGCIADAGPDAWGMRVIMRRELGSASTKTDPAALTALTYLLESGSDRIGALDFQRSATEYVTRQSNASLEELLKAAERLEQGLPFSRELDDVLLHGSSIGGARPKALLADGGAGKIAKFSSLSDTYPVVKGEYAAMELARRVGLEVATVSLTRALDKDVLLVDRFDRVGDTGARRSMVSALTILELDELMARYASYADLAHVIRERFTDAARTLRQLFARITFNILVGNIDDHARNHAAFWDGEFLALTPAYDICPQPRSVGEVNQAMAIGSDGFRSSQVAGCVAAASAYFVSESDAREIIDHQIETIQRDWPDVADQAELSEQDREYFWQRQFLNPFAIEGYR